jgi:hypothetical protein
MISDSYDQRTLANMEVALERACALMASRREEYAVRRHIADRILECAAAGDRTLGSLTEAGRAAASELSRTLGARAG